MTVGLSQAQQPDGRLPISQGFFQAFTEIPAQDRVISTHDPFDFSFGSGHIQGIQLYSQGGVDYVYMTRSDPKVAYMLTAKLDGTTATVLSIDTLMLEPYGHPGGFQIFGNYLAVGIEDADKRNTSRVVVYDLEKGDNKSWADPLHVIKRDGAYERVTAGCVGLTQVGKYIVMAVGNWHSRELDFYISPFDKFIKGEDGFRLIHSMNMAKVSKEGWSDAAWHSYQNINLFADGADRLYLVGLGGEGAELYQLQIVHRASESGQSPIQDAIKIKKLQTKTLSISGNASFNAGAGISQLPNGELILLAAPDDVGGSSTISVFRRE